MILGDPTGALWGTLLCLAFSVALGVLSYGVIVRLASMGSMDGGGRAGRGAGIVFGVVMSCAAFVAFYASSVAGFYDFHLDGDRVVLHYLFPERYVTRTAVNLLKVEQEPAFKSRWRLAVHDVDGEVYQSALASQQDVQRAYALLNPVIDPESLPRPSQALTSR